MSQSAVVAVLCLLSLAAVAGQTVPAPAPATSPVTVRVNATTFNNRDYINVSWSGVPQPGPADAIIAIQENQVLNATIPQRFQFCARSADYVTSGAGSLVFQALNQRTGIQYLFVSNLTNAVTLPFQVSTSAVQGKSPVVLPNNVNEPTQVHLAVTFGGPSNMLVQWTTRDAGTPTVKYGTQPGSLTSTATGNTSTYTREQMCAAPANTTGWISPGTQNQVNLTGLMTSTVYYYQVGDPNYGYRNQTFSFLTAPPVGNTSSIEVLINADPGHALRDGAYEADVYDTTLNLDVRLVTAQGSSADIYSAINNQFHGNGLQQGASLGIFGAMAGNISGRTIAFQNGDLSYARGSGTQWDVHFDQVEDFGSSMPVMVVEGNHERDQPHTGDRFQNTATDSGGECGIPTHLRYLMPTEAPALDGQYWYSFDFGPVHYLAYSTELDYAAGSAQNAFIQADLAAVNRTRTPWVIANLHRPIYTSSISGVSQSSDMQGGADQRAAFENLFYMYGVDVTFCGHVHWYERTCPVLQKTCIANNPDGSAGAPVHITLGNGGQWLSSMYNPNQPEWLQALAIEHGYMQYSVNATTFQGTMYSSVTGEIMDEVLLTKPPGFQLNSTVRAAQLANFEPDPSLGDNWIDNFGIDGGITSNVSALLLSILQANPSMYAQLQNATLVQNVNAVDTLQNTFQILKPAFDLLLEPSVQNSPQLTPEAQVVVQEFFLPWYAQLNNGSNPNPYIMGATPNAMIQTSASY